MIATLAICGMTLLPMAADAQRPWSNNRYDRDPYYGRSTYDVRRLVDATERSSDAFRQVIERREDWIDDQIRDNRYDRRDDRWNDRDWRDRDRYNDRYDDRYRRNDTDYLRVRDRFLNELKPRVQRLDESMERLRRAVHSDNRNSARNEMQSVLRYAQEIDRMFPDRDYGWRYDSRTNRPTRIPNWSGGNNRRGQRISARWADLRRDINACARAMNLSEVGRSRRWYW
ncbi:MAG TPA: hypothetical protein VGE01_13315 [Fimbriimonas sp.]